MMWNTCWWEGKLLHSVVKVAWKWLIIETEIPHNPVILIMDIYSKIQKHSYKEIIRTYMFIKTLLGEAVEAPPAVIRAYSKLYAQRSFLAVLGGNICTAGDQIKLHI